jgi:lactoylglutathione lyase
VGEVAAFCFQSCNPPTGCLKSTFAKNQHSTLTMKFAYTILYVPNVAQALAFYESAFGLTRGFVHECGDYAELQTGETALSFASLTLAESNVEGGVTPSDLAHRPPAFELAFSTDDVAASYERALAAGASSATPPTLKPWGQTVSYVRDVFGNLVEICTPIPVPEQ